MQFSQNDPRPVLRRLETDTVLFLTGAAGYALIEVLYRGHTHWSMGVAGGICFTVFGHRWETLRTLPKIYMPIFGSALVTGVELVFGLIFNIGLTQQVWDYSRLPFNFMGQICVLFSCLWGLLCIPAIPVAGLMHRRLCRNLRCDGKKLLDNWQ